MGPRGATDWPGLIPLIKEDGDLDLWDRLEVWYVAPESF